MGARQAEEQDPNDTGGARVPSPACKRERTRRRQHPQHGAAVLHPASARKASFTADRTQCVTWTAQGPVTKALDMVSTVQLLHMVIDEDTRHETTEGTEAYQNLQVACAVAVLLAPLPAQR